MHNQLVSEQAFLWLYGFREQFYGALTEEFSSPSLTEARSPNGNGGYCLCASCTLPTFTSATSNTAPRNASTILVAVFLHLVEQAIDQQVDFLLVAGDLFEKRTVDPLAMRVAVEGLRMLREAGIPVVAVEGNHEKAHYRDQYSWVDFLDGLGYLHLLNPRFEKERAILEPYGDEGGAYLDLPGGVRVYGLKYYGASTGKVFGLFADALAEIDHSDVQFTILMAHAGLEGQLPRYSGTLTHNDLAPLREQIDYLALGHIHKPYAVEGWIYNPGSPETWSIEETAWPERGYFLVEVQPGSNPNHQARLVPTPRRPFHRSRLEVDALTEPNVLYDAVRGLLQARGQQRPSRSGPGGRTDLERCPRLSTALTSTWTTSRA